MAGRNAGAQHRDFMGQKGLANRGGGGGGGGIPNPIPELLVVQWGTLAGPSGSWGWVLDGFDQLNLIGTPLVGDGAVTFTTSPLTVKTGDSTQNVAGAGVLSGFIEVQSGDVDQTDAGATGSDSGSVALRSGSASATAGAPGASGSASLQSGTAQDGCDSGTVNVASGLANGGGLSGDVNVFSGFSLGSDTGDASVFSGAALGVGNSGAASVKSGNASNGASGDATLSTGSAAGGASGPVSVNSGGSDAASGDVDVFSGATTGPGQSGQVIMQSGTTAAPGTRSGSAVCRSGNSTDGDTGSATVESGDAGGAARVSGAVVVRSGGALLGATGNVEVYGGVAPAGQPRGQVQIGRDDALLIGRAPGAVDYASPLPLQLNGADVGTDRFVIDERWLLRPHDPGAGLIALGDNLCWDATPTGGGAVALDPDGGITCNTGALLGSQAKVEPSISFQNAWKSTSWHGAHSIDMRGAVATTANTADQVIQWGIRPTVGAFDNTPVGDAFFLSFIPGASPNWQFVTRNGAAIVVFDTLVPVLAATLYGISVRIVPTTRQIALYINGERANGATSIVGAADLGDPFMGIEAGAAAIKVAKFYPLALGQRIF